jgi:hypothetical protein
MAHSLIAGAARHDRPSFPPNTSGRRTEAHLCNPPPRVRCLLWCEVCVAVRGKRRARWKGLSPPRCIVCVRRPRPSGCGIAAARRLRGPSRRGTCTAKPRSGSSSSSASVRGKWRASSPRWKLESTMCSISVTLPKRALPAFSGHRRTTPYRREHPMLSLPL